MQLLFVELIEFILKMKFYRDIILMEKMQKIYFQLYLLLIDILICLKKAMEIQIHVLKMI